MSNNTALLVMDYQNVITGMLPDSAPVIGKVAQAIAHARSNKVPVIYVVVGFRAGAPEISANNKMFSASKARFSGLPPAEFIAIHPDLAPVGEEPVVVKRRVSGFAGSDLEVLLRSLDIKHMVLAGIATSGVVLSTLREAADKDFQITVLADACADRETDVHEMLMEKVFPRQADVVNVSEWVKG